MKTRIFFALFITIAILMPFRLVSQTNCLTPVALTTSNITTTGATLSWTAPSGGAYTYVYLVQYKPVASTAWTNVTSQTTSIVLSNLTCGTQYEWKIASYCGNSGSTGNISPYSQSITFNTLACTNPCTAPTGLVVSNITATGAMLSWTAPPGGAYAYILQYRPVTSPASNWISITTQTDSVILSNLVCGNQYEWQVAAHCIGTPGTYNISPYSQSITFNTLACTNPCTAPTGLVVSNITTTGAMLSWTVPPGGAYAYVVQYRPVTSPASNWITVTTQTNSIILSNLVCGKQYEWHVAAHCSNGTGGYNISPYSQSITFNTLVCVNPCSAPTGLVVSGITTNGAILSWTSSSGIYAYIVQYRPVTSPASNWTNVATQADSIVLANLTCGTKYEWRVASYCSNYPGTNNNINPFSQVVFFNTLACPNPCTAPNLLTVTNVTATSAILSWVSPPGGAYAYIVKYRKITAPSSGWIVVTTQADSILLTNLVCGTQYEWCVAAHCSNNPGSYNISPYSQTLTFGTAACPPPCIAPAGLVVSNVTQTSAVLSWTAPTGVNAFIVQYRPVTSPMSNWITVTTQADSIVLANLTCGTKYEWRVASYCSNYPGTGSNVNPFSQSLIFNTLACPNLCTAPTGLVVSNITATGATLSWVAPPIGAYIYIIKYRKVTSPASNWTVVSTQADSVVLSNLACGSQYEWHVAAYCSNSSAAYNISPYSQSITFNTLNCINPCLAPTNLVVSNITTTGVTLSWTTPSGGAYVYIVHYRPVTSTVTNWISVTTQADSVVLSNLVCGKQYEWQVASYCGNMNTTNISNYAQGYVFTTLPCNNNTCATPTGLYSVITGTNPLSITLYWNSTNATSYTIRYKKAGSYAYTTITSATDSVVISGLYYGQYVWQVQSVCSPAGGATAVSPWSAQAYFSIPYPANAIYPNPVYGNNSVYMPVYVENDTRFSVIISDRFGNPLSSFDKVISAGQTTLDIDISYLQSGVYNIQVISDVINDLQRIVIMK